MSDFIDAFERELDHWIQAYVDTQVLTVTDDDRARLINDLTVRIPEDLRSAIGEGLNSKFLKTDEPGYFVYPASDRRRLARQYVFNSQLVDGERKPHPCWELYVQLAEAVRCKHFADKFGLDLRIEDRLMDITLSKRTYIRQALVDTPGARRVVQDLVAYVEIKVAAREAQKLRDWVTQYGQDGVEFESPSKGNDALKKARYIARHHPRVFSIRAIDFTPFDSLVTYQGERQFTLQPIADGFEAALVQIAEPAARPVIANYETLEFDPIDALRAVLEEHCPELDFDVGSGQTAYNIRIALGDRQPILLGVYQDGQLWSDLQGFSPAQRELLARLLGEIGVEIDPDKAWTFWRSNGDGMNISDLDGRRLARQVRKLLDSRLSPP